MKNFIKYNYNIDVEDCKKKEDNYIFVSNKVNYLFKPYEFDAQKLKDIYYYLYNTNIYYDEILYNKDMSLLSRYNNKNYVLLKKKAFEDSISLEQIIKYNVPIYKDDFINWKTLWEKKIDYYENQMSEFGFKYNELSDFFNYYVGLSEIAIQLLNDVKNVKFDLFIEHKKIKQDGMFDPTNIIFDSYVRDLAEFIKFKYLFDEIKLNEIISIINNINFNNSTAILFLSRIVYPSYFFDVYDKVIDDKINSNKILDITKKSTDFEALFKTVYNILSRKYDIPNIEWLKY